MHFDCWKGMLLLNLSLCLSLSRRSCSSCRHVDGVELWLLGRLGHLLRPLLLARCRWAFSLAPSFFE